MGLFCTKCGSKTLAEAKFCAACGNKLTPSISPSTKDVGLNPISREYAYASGAAGQIKVQPDLEVKTLFVIGSQTPRDSENWLKSKFPNSQIIRFSTIGAIREAAKRKYAIGQIESLCLMGTAKTVPTGFLHEESESDEYQDNHPFWSVESDLLYVESGLLFHELPSTSVSDPSNFLQRINGHVIEGGILALGRIPSDNLEFWQSYFQSLESFSSAPIACIAISNYPPDWINETRATLTNARNSGCMSQSLYTLGALESDDIDLSNDAPEDFADGSRIIVNLHGGFPEDSEPTQELTTNNPNYSLQLTSFNSFPRSILYMFSCYGGNSGWWRSGGVIPHFLENGGIAVIASSSVSFVSVLDEDVNIVRSSALMCAEFFKNIDAGFTFGDAIKLAKMRTFMAALDDLDSAPWLFCVAIKEVFQFSLYGAPWATVNPRPIKEATGSSGILDKIRSGGASNTLSAIKAGAETLNQVREALHKSLGEQGIKYFSNTNNYVIGKLTKNGKLGELSSELGDLGFDINYAHFESVSWSGKSYTIATLRDENKPNQAAMLLILDDEGNLITKMEAKG